MSSRSLVIVVVLFGSLGLLRPAAAQPMPKSSNDGSSARFWRPGWLQRHLLAVDDPPTKPASPPNPSPSLKNAKAGEPTPARPPVLTPPPPPPPGPEKSSGLEPPPSGGEAGGLNLDTPQLGSPPASSGGGGAAPGGGTGSIVFGGTLDYRFLFPKEMPKGMYMIHVNELFITTNIGDHISILAEQLLLTSETTSSVGLDHGFVYAIFSNLPILPEGSAIRVGRMRLRYGIDAKLDAPANPLRTPEYRTIGILSDRAVELSGYFGSFDYVAAISMGPDFELREVVGPTGQIAGTIKAPTDPSFHPIFVRLGTNFSGRPNLGVSGYYGDTYPVLAADGFQAGDSMLFGGFLDQSRQIRKERLSLDARWDYWKLKLAGEVTIGRDREDTRKPTVQAYFARADLAIKPQKWTAQLQYDYFDDGRPETPNIGAASAALTYNLTDESWLRAFGQGNQRLLRGERAAWLLGTQMLMAF